MVGPKKVILAGLIFVAAAFIQTADAALELLPESSYYEGSTTYTIVTCLLYTSDAADILLV